jgi:hypothetical protein
MQQMVNQALRELSRDFQAIYSQEKRPSLGPKAGGEGKNKFTLFLRDSKAGSLGPASFFQFHITCQKDNLSVRLGKCQI